VLDRFDSFQSFVGYLEACGDDHVAELSQVRGAVVVPECMDQRAAISGKVWSLDQADKNLIDTSHFCLCETKRQGVACCSIRDIFQRQQFCGGVFEMLHERLLARIAKVR